MLSGVKERHCEQLHDTKLLGLLGRESVFPAEAVFGASLRDALETAQDRVASGAPRPPEPGGGGEARGPVRRPAGQGSRVRCR